MTMVACFPFLKYWLGYRMPLKYVLTFFFSFFLGALDDTIFCWVVYCFPVVCRINEMKSRSLFSVLAGTCNLSESIGEHYCIRKFSRTVDRLLPLSISSYFCDSVC